MKFYNRNFRREFKQLKSWAKRVNALLGSGQFSRLSSDAQQRFVGELGRSYRLLNSGLSARHMRRVLAGSALLLGLSVNAQQFEAPVTNPFDYSASTEFVLPSFVDIDDDGDQDLFVSTQGVILYYENTGSAEAASFGAAITNPFDLEPQSELSWITFGDIDDDGDYDSIMGSDTGDYYIFRNLGDPDDPDFANPQTNNYNLISAYQYSMPALVDMDGDGDLDLLSTEYGGSLEFYENSGTSEDPEFEIPLGNMEEYEPSFEVSLMAVGDLNWDNRPDLLMGSGGDDGGVAFYPNVGEDANDIAWGEAQESPFGIAVPAGEFAALALVDIDGDGDLDLFSGGYEGDLYFYQNVGELPSAPSVDMINSFDYCNDDDELEIELTNIAPGFDGALVELEVTSSDEDVIPEPTIFYQSGGDVALLVFDLEEGTEGTSTIEVSLDNSLTVNNLTEMSFDVTLKECGVANEDLAAAIDLDLYPNPVTDQVYMSLSADLPTTQTQVKVMNANGQLVATQSWSTVETCILDVASLSAGHYWIEIVINETKISKKFVKQ